MSWVSTTPGSDSAAVMRASVGLLRGAPGGIRVIKNMTNSPWWEAYAPHHRCGPASALRSRQCCIERFARPHHRRGHLAVRRVVAAEVHRLALYLGEFGHDDVFVLGQRIG